MRELVCNLHIHSKYSDGTGDYATIANAALRQNLDVVIITDHNVLVEGVERFIESDGKKVLLLTGEEVHDQNRLPQKNHTLVIGARREVSSFAGDPQKLMDEVANWKDPPSLPIRTNMISPCSTNRIFPGYPGR